MSTALLVGALGWGLFETPPLRRYAFSLLVAYLWAVSIGVGALCWIALGHLIGARWQVAFRRLAELLTASLPRITLIGGVLLIPVLVGSPLVYGWVGARVDAPELAARARYLSPWGFALRALLYWLVWNLLARYFLSRSRAQDRTGAPNLLRGMRRASAPALIALVLSLTFAAVDWIMSLDPGFVSAVFGLYFVMGCLVGALGALSVLAVALAHSADLREVVGPRHYYDLGRSLFTFVLLWAYVAFCQILLIWYTNLPDEAEWLGRRLNGGWGAVTLLLAAVHCFVPLFGMLSRQSRQNPRWLAFWAAWLLGAHYLDLYWLVMPELDRSGPPLHPFDLICLLGLAGWMVSALERAARSGKLAPVGDPRLAPARPLHQD